MLKLVAMSLTGLMILALVACGAAAPPEEAPTAAPATEAPTATRAAPLPPSAQGETLQAAASRLAGGPGAIYAGDLSLMAGPAPVPDLGGFDGNVPLDALERHLYLYEHPFYQGLLEKANYNNPTQLVSSGEEHVIQHACVNRGAPSLYPGGKLPSLQTCLSAPMGRWKLSLRRSQNWESPGLTY